MVFLYFYSFIFISSDLISIPTYYIVQNKLNIFLYDFYDQFSFVFGSQLSNQICQRIYRIYL